MKRIRSHIYAFTLVELSIVLVVIGLIVSGVLVGQQLIEAAKVRTVGKEIQNYLLAFNTFTLKYNYPPGDLPDATNLWPNDSLYAGFDIESGDGNRVLEGNEPSNSLEHLSAAGMVEGLWMGRGETSLCNAGIDYPASDAYAHAGYYFAAGWWATGNKPSLEFGGERSVSPCGNRNGVFNTFQAVKWDTKYDDGKGNSGKYRFTYGWDHGSLYCNSGGGDAKICRPMVQVD